MKRTAVALALVALALLAGSVAATNGLDIPRHVIGNGSEPAEAGAFEVQSSIGQMSVGAVNAAPYEVCSGFWCMAKWRYRIYVPLVLKEAP